MTDTPVKKKKDKHLPADPLHGITLEKILNDLVDNYGWKEMGETVRIKCFNVDPSIKSSLTFLRRTPWARSKVERMYIRLLRAQSKQKKKLQNF